MKTRRRIRIQETGNRYRIRQGEKSLPKEHASTPYPRSGPPGSSATVRWHGLNPRELEVAGVDSGVVRVPLRGRSLPGQTDTWRMVGITSQ